MKHNFLITICILCCVFVSADTLAQTDFKVHNAIKEKVSYFPLNEVSLLPSLFKNAMDKDGAYLLSLKPDRFLNRFRINAGLQPKDSIYGGWEKLGVSGHSLGHYLSACSMMYAASGDKRYKEKVNYIVDELAVCQQARKTGYVGAIVGEDSLWDEVAAGDIRSGALLNGFWVPWYTLHKDLAGLIDAYQYTNNKKALDVATKFCNWIDVKFKHLTEEQFQTMLDCEHGGMNESLADIYALTGNKKYLELSYKFNHKKILDPLANGEDILPGKHANTQIPKIIGAARQYELTGNEKENRTATYFWETVVNHHSYVIGGNSNFEHFDQPDKLANNLSDNTTETCNSYNMLKLTRHLFALNADTRYMDYYERTLYNHILASIHPETGMTCYYVPLIADGKKTYSTPTESFWCCTGTGMENHVKYANSIYAKGNDGSLYINLFIPSTLNWKERNVNLTMQTALPSSDTVSIVMNSNANLPLHIRYPAWLTNGITVLINGKNTTINANPGSYFTLNNSWKSGDKIQVIMPMSIRQESMNDNKNRIALLYGPVVLSGMLGQEKTEQMNIPVFVSDKDNVNAMVHRVSNVNTLGFQTTATNDQKNISLIPFYEAYNSRYIVYFDKFTTDAWAVKKKEYEAELKRQETIKARTVDVMRIGEMQPERDHHLKGEHTNTGEAVNRKWRDAVNGGWFSFTMNTQGNTALQLICTYWGSDGGNRDFDILVDDIKIASQQLEKEKPNEFFDVVYVIPEELVKNKQTITIKFQAKPNNTAGGVFGCRLLKAE